MKKLLLIFLLVGIFFSAYGLSANKFGKDGLTGLSKEQIKKLDKGEFIFLTKGSSKNALVQAVIVFNKSPEVTWNLLAKSEDQVKFLKELKTTKVIYKKPNENDVEFLVKVAFIKKLYRVIHKFDKNKLYMHWALDSSFKKNDVEALKGYWKFYPYKNGKTLARYGTLFTLKGVPDWIQNLFKKNGVQKSLRAIRKYVNSGGTWHK